MTSRRHHQHRVEPFARLVLLTALVVARPAQSAAQPVPPPATEGEARRAEARDRFQRGLELFEAGDNAAALAEFQRAHELVPNQQVLLNVGLVYAAMNRPVDATRTLDRVLATPTGLTPDRLAQARRVRDEQSRRVARVALRTNVPAIVEIDGVEAARTPLAEPLHVPAGAHVLAVLAPDHLPSRREITVAGGATYDVELTLVPSERRLAHLTVRAQVPDAQVVIDGEVVGRTPLPASVAVTPGRRVVELRRRGYLSARTEITLDEGAAGEVALALEEDAAATETGSVRVAASETDVQLTIDGRPRGVYREPVRLPVGPHRFRFERGGFLATERVVDVPLGSEATVEVSLVPTAETRQRHVDAARGRRRWAYVALAGGVALAAGSTAFLLVNEGSLEDARSDLAVVVMDQARMGGGMCDPARNLTSAQIAVCEATLADAQGAVDDAESRRILPFVGYGAAAVALGVGSFLLLTGEDPGKYDAPRAASPYARWAPRPLLTRDLAGAAVVGRF